MKWKNISPDLVHELWKIYNVGFEEPSTWVMTGSMNSPVGASDNDTDSLEVLNV